MVYTEAAGLLLPDVEARVFEATRGMRLVFLADAPDYTITAVSRDMCLHLGMNKEDLIGRSVFVAFPAASGDWGQLGQHGIKASLDYVMLHKMEHNIAQQRYDVPNATGGFRESYWRNFSTPVLDDEGAVAYIIHTTEEITEDLKVDAEHTAHLELMDAYRKMQESEAKYRSLFDSMDQGFCVLEMLFDEAGRPVDYRFLETNVVFGSHTGLKDAVGKTARELVPELEQHWVDLYGAVAATGIPTRFVQGSEAMGRWFDVYAYRTQAAGSHCVALLFTDISERRKAEERIRKSEENLRNIILQAPAAMCLLKGPAHVIEIANDRMFELWGKIGAEILGKPIFEGLPEARDQGFEDMLDGVFNTGKTMKAFAVPTRLPRSTGLETIYLDFVYEAYREQDGTISGVMAVATDITEQVISRKKIEEAEERARLAIDAGELGTVEVNLQTEELNMSPKMEQIFGVKPGSTRGAYISAIHPEDLPMRERAYRRAYRTGELEYEVRLMRKDVATRWIRVRGRVFFDEEGKPLRLLSVVQDITEERDFAEELTRMVEQRTAQLQAANKELERSNEELQQFAHIASHDLKEPVRKIMTFSQMLESSDGPTLSHLGKLSLQKVQSSAERMMNMVNGVLAYSKLEAINQAFEPMDLEVTIAGVESDLEVLIQQTGATISKTALPHIMGAPVLNQQLFYNLVNNALKFRKEGVPPQISISAELPAGGMVRILVEDNGIGFEPEYAERIFTTFTRLNSKDHYEGTGLGLSLCRKIAERHGGSIIAEATPGAGARFTVSLPAAQHGPE
jgi:PAS domain S-box-containing protein